MKVDTRVPIAPIDESKAIQIELRARHETAQSFEYPELDSDRDFIALTTVWTFWASRKPKLHSFLPRTNDVVVDAVRFSSIIVS